MYSVIPTTYLFDQQFVPVLEKRAFEGQRTTLYHHGFWVVFVYWIVIREILEDISIVPFDSFKQQLPFAVV